METPISRKMAVAMVHIMDLEDVLNSPPATRMRFDFASAFANSPGPSASPTGPSTPPSSSPPSRQPHRAASREHLRELATPGMWRLDRTRTFFVSGVTHSLRDRCLGSCCLMANGFVSQSDGSRACAASSASLFAPAQQRTNDVLNPVVATIYWRHKGNYKERFVAVAKQTGIPTEAFHIVPSCALGSAPSEPMVVHVLILNAVLGLLALGADDLQEDVVLLVTRKTAATTLVKASDKTHSIGWLELLGLRDQKFVKKASPVVALADATNRGALVEAFVKSAVDDARRMFGAGLDVPDNAAALFRIVHLMETVYSEFEASAAVLTDEKNATCYMPKASHAAIMGVIKRTLSKVCANVDNVRRRLLLAMQTGDEKENESSSTANNDELYRSKK